ncbi:oxidoreductase [Desulforhopalus singaporensis]|uniref:2,4-dienoyl-CoA reductase n=1 Tax=Desulforhopalus singaporensis TaxID=91360 RepID=A0A1H0U337_9BACT|nr:FAD-dependent oxidoreductase [Desulforhopalus singaporensis]SDP60561.1 2,4-dienoyl-CoA reductase [Desulforhopalus singaporensis]
MTSPDLTAPLSSGNLQLPNRLCFSGHVTNLSDGPFLSDRHLAYFRQRLSGNIGMLVNDPLPVHPSSDTLRTKLTLNAETTQSFTALTKACQSHNVKAVQQLYHAGAHGFAKTSFHPSWSPGGAPSLHDQDTSHKMSGEEIDILIESFVTHALNAQEAGFDGIEIVAGANMLFEQFWSPLTNPRDDRWGGTFEKRMTFSTEVVERIRKTVGEKFIIGLVMTSCDGYPTSLSDEELEAIVSYHDALGCIDYFSFSIDDDLPENLDRQLDRIARYRNRIANGCLRVAGNVTTPERAEHILHRGGADFVGMTRALIADPSLMEKYRSGDRQSIRPCVGCNQGCIGRRARDYTVACLANPSAGRELRFPETVPQAKAPLKILVAGGGLAGMEAARSAAEAGHHVILAERGEELGGQWRLAGLLPKRSAYQKLLDWYRYQFQLLGIVPLTGTEINRDKLQASDFDHLIIATGAGPTKTGFQRPLPNRSVLPGVHSENVYPVEDVLSGITPLDKTTNARVLVLDDIGFRQGIGTALFLANLGHEVTFITRHAIPSPETLSLKDHEWLPAKLTNLGVTLLTETLLLSWNNGVAEYGDSASSAPHSSRFDFLVLATTNSANQELENQVAETPLSYSLAGDCQGARKGHMAIYEGRKAIMAIHCGDDKC